MLRLFKIGSQYSCSMRRGISNPRCGDLTLILLPLAIPSRCRPHTECLFPSSIVRFTPAVFYSELITDWREFPSPRTWIRGRGPRTNTSRGTLPISLSSIDASPGPESSRRSPRC
ncbi:hypothetical protein K523DRAFT_113556 [Schizophyllum commune Tattone D]|nr:hypothetical protein K523DRAFT_113556 [Schizophyllum commune Tattone D]